MFIAYTASPVDKNASVFGEFGSIKPIIILPLKHPFIVGFPISFPLKHPFIVGFPISFPLKHPFIVGFPISFPLKHPFIVGFPISFPLKHPFIVGFPIYSHDFPIWFHGSPIVFPCPSHSKKPLPFSKKSPSERQRSPPTARLQRWATPRCAWRWWHEGNIFFSGRYIMGRNFRSNCRNYRRALLLFEKNI